MTFFARPELWIGWEGEHQSLSESRVIHYINKSFDKLHSNMGHEISREHLAREVLAYVECATIRVTVVRSGKHIAIPAYLAKQWNLDPTRICLTGGSAGGGISLWIGFHDDLADPKSNDPVARESTRVTCIAPFNTQTTYDPRVLKTIISAKEYKHPSLMAFYGIKDTALADSPTPELAKLFEEVSPINYLTADDPPVHINYKAEMNGIHSVKLGHLLKEKMDALHIECTIRGPQVPQYDSEQMEFIKKHLLGEKK